MTNIYIFIHQTNGSNNNKATNTVITKDPITLQTCRYIIFQLIIIFHKIM